jgi:NAD(P)-dependent dehydrogenase (short-subunit alcohol dehydrogenase family)
MKPLHERIVVVTGAAGAVGSATARAVAEAGGCVLATDVRECDVRDALDTRVIETMGLDVTSEDAWDGLAKRVRATWGRLDGLVTCAAVLDPQDADIESVPRDVWEQTQAVNSTGVMLASRTAVALMRQRQTGSIVHLGSIVANRGSATSQVAYAASKGAASALTRELAVACAPLGIRVNAVVPGLLAASLTAGLVASSTELARRLAHIPMGRLGDPQEVAAAAAWLLSDEASYVTGTELVVDGGLQASFVTGHET